MIDTSIVTGNGQQEAIRVRDSSGAIYLTAAGYGLVHDTTDPDFIGTPSETTREEHTRLTNIAGTTLRAAQDECYRRIADATLDPSIPRTLTGDLRFSLDSYLSMHQPTMVLLHWLERGLFALGATLDEKARLILERYQEGDDFTDLFRPLEERYGQIHWLPRDKEMRELLSRQPRDVATLLNEGIMFRDEHGSSYTCVEDVVAHDLAYCIQSGLFTVNESPEGSAHVRIWPPLEYFFRKEKDEKHADAMFRYHEEYGFIHNGGYFTNLANLFLSYLKEKGARVTSMQVSHTQVTDDLCLPDTIQTLEMTICRNIHGAIDLQRPSLRRIDFSADWLLAPFPNLPDHLRGKMNPVIERLIVEHPERDDHTRSLSYLFNVHMSEQEGIDPNRLVHILGPNQQTIIASQETTRGLVERLLEAGIPEEAIERNAGLWTFVQAVERDAIVSANRVFSVTDRDGKAWKLKITSNKQKAYVEAAANYYLSSHFDFIVPGAFSKPLEANGLYLTMQEDVSDKVTAARPLAYWINAYALFHRDAEAILREANIVIPDAPFHTLDEFREQHERGRHEHTREGIPFDPERLQASIDYLRSSPHQAAIHRDGKRDNMVGSYLVDLECIARGDPAIDLALLFTRYHLPEERWDHHLAHYLAAKGNQGKMTESFGRAIQELHEGVREAVVYTAYKEVLGSSLRSPREETRRGNAQLVRQLDRLAA